MLQTNTLVIGGGPAGSTTARYLSGMGIETILVERDLSYIKPCGGGIPSPVFQEFSIPNSVIKKEVGKIRIVTPKGERIDVELKGGHLCITDRGDFDSKLREMAKNSGALIIEGEFIRFEELNKNIISIIRKKATNEEIRIKSNYVVASDGITFKVGAAVKIPKHDYLHTISAHIKPIVSASSNESGKGTGEGDMCEFWFGSQNASYFYSWIFPSAEYCSIGTGTTNPKELTKLLDRFLRRRFNESLETFSEKNFLGKPRAFKIPLWHGAPLNVKNIFFVGDAAGAVMPLTYEGIYYAMKSGEFAATAIKEGNPKIYKKLWNGRFRNRFLLMSKIKNYFFKSDENIEKWLLIHKKPEVQEIAMRLFLKKESKSGSLISYINCFRHLFKKT
jgi:geranylgeranyl reductase